MADQGQNPTAPQSDSHTKHINEDLNNFVEDLKQEGKIAQDESSVKRKSHRSRRKEPTYCVCHQVSFGDMIACDNEKCRGGEWFHYPCIGLNPETRIEGKWYCPTCRQLA